MTATSLPQPYRIHWWAYGVVALAWTSYVLLTTFAPSTGNPNQLRLSFTQQLAISASIVVPILIIWLVALRGAEVFKAYGRLIGDEAEGRAINSIANGLLLTLAYLICTQLWGASMAYWAHTPYLQPAVLVRDHLPVIITVAAFSLLYRGSNLLRRRVRVRTWSAGVVAALLSYSVFAAGLVWLFLTETRINNGIIPIYSLPRPVLLFTLTLPYMIAWGLGLLAAFNIAKYSRQVKGVIYRQALRDLAWGVMTVAIFLTTYAAIGLLNRYLLGLKLWLILVIFWGLLTLYGLSFWFIRRGAKKLMRLEVMQ